MWRDRMQIDTEVDSRPDSEQEQPVWENTIPRDNQDPDDHDLDRSLEKLETLLGH
jgi:hypothetical protein